MRPLLLAVPMMIFALAASAQNLPNAPNLPTAGAPSMGGSPAQPKPAANTPSGTSLPGAAPTSSNPLEKAKTEAECKIPTNAAKPECLELMLKK